MTLAATKATGSGRLEYRLQVEGLAFCFVTKKTMEQTDSLGREWIGGLSRKMTIGDESIPFEASIDAPALKALIVDRQRDDRVTRALFKRPTKRTWLMADVSISDTALTVASTAGFSNGEIIHIGTEAIVIGTVASATSFTGCTRAYRASTLQAHFAASEIDHLTLAAVTDEPLALEGRRAELYAYGERDDKTDTGTRIWRGRVATDAKLLDNHSGWTFTLDPVSSLLKTDLGADLGETHRARGIYYHAREPLTLFYGEATTDAISGVYSGDFLTGDNFIYGFFANNEDLCAEITTRFAALVSAVSGTAQNVRAVADGDSDWHLEITVHATDPQFPIFGAYSPSDGQLGTAFHAFRGRGSPSGLLDADGTEVRTVTAGATYTAGSADTLPGLRSVPRGFVGFDPTVTIRITDPDEPPTADYPIYRVHLAGVSSIASVDACEWKLPGTIVGLDQGTGWVTPDTAERAINVNATGTGHFGRVFHGVHTSQLPVEFVFRKSLTIGGSPGSLYDMLTYLIANARQECNRGGLPLVSAADLDTSQEVIEAAAIHPWQRERRYMQAESTDLAEFIAAECRLLGIFPIINGSGQIEFRPLPQLSGVTVPDWIIDSSAIGVDVNLPTWERNAWGSLNRAVLHVGYDPWEDEWATTVTVHDVTAYSTRKSPRELVVKPRSYSHHGDDLTLPYAQVAAVFSPVLGLFGRDYALVNVDVPWKFFDALVGDTVSLTYKSLPDGAGGRGIEDQIGMIVGRQWSLDTAAGRLKILIPYEDVSGYTPSVSVDSPSNVSGNQWDVDVTSLDPYGVADFFQPDNLLSDHFAVGYRVAVSAWDSASPSAINGTVDAVTDNGTNPATGTLRITLDSAWTPAGNMVIGFSTDTSDHVSGQRAYMYLADGATYRIDFGTPVAAKVWAP